MLNDLYAHIDCWYACAVDYVDVDSVEHSFVDLKIRLGAKLALYRNKVIK